MEDELKSSLLSSDHGKGRENLTSVRNLLLLGSFNLMNGVLAGLAMLAKIQQYVPRYHMSLIWGSCVDFLMTIAGVYASIFIGWFGDKVKMRWGKRKPLLLVSYPLKMLAMLMLMFPPESQMSNPVFVRVWYMSCMCAWWALYTIFSSVFSSWFIELLMPSEYQDYIVFASAVPSLLGFLIGSGLSFVNALDQIGLGLAVCALALLIA
jgi:Na+/melibiose symporter-like transporter